MTDSDKRYDPKLDFIVKDPNHTADDINFLATAKEQRRFNSIAATYTALAILDEAEISLIV